MRGRERTRVRAPRSILAAAFAFVTLLFLVHEALTRRSFDASLAQVESIVDDAMPSIVDLVEARQILTNLRFAIDRENDAGRTPQRTREVQALLDALYGRVRDFEHLPTVPGEEVEQRTLDDNVATLRSAAEDFLSEREPKAADAVFERRVMPALDAVADTIATLVEKNARETAKVTRDVVTTHAAAKEISLVLLATILAITGGVAIIVDRALARAEREASRRIEELDAFAARVAHDLRGPLQPVLFALAMTRRGELAEGAEKAVARAEHSIRQMVDLIDALLEFARSGAHPAPCTRTALDGAVRGAVATLERLAEEERARVHLEVESGLVVAASEGVITSIVSNLARNALLYLGDSPERIVTVRVRRTGGDALVEVQDTGPGIPPDVLDRLFRPFERGSARAGGHGLGLATVSRLAQAHGRRVEVESHVGAGTTFRVRLPLATA